MLARIHPAVWFCLTMMTALTATADATLLVRTAETWYYHKGTNAPQTNWQVLADSELDPTQWAMGDGGFGFAADNTAETAECRTLLTDMQNLYSTFYIRKTFEVTNTIDTSNHLYFVADFDDGYVAYLDGVILSRTNSGLAYEPAYNFPAPYAHESSRGNMFPQPAHTNDTGAVANRLQPGLHVLAVMGLNLTKANNDFILLAELAHAPYVPPPPIIGGPITSNMTLSASSSPYTVASNLTVAAGFTLTIQPGVTVLLNGGVGITVNGRLLAEGTADARIRFARKVPGSAWSRILIENSPSESRFAYCDIDGASSTGNITANHADLYLDHVVFTNTLAQLVTLDVASCTIQHCHFPSIQNNELIHFLTMPANGHALLLSNLFGTPGIPTTTGYNDIIDFTGGNRPGPIVEFIGNVFLSSVDDVFDMDGTDAHIEGNVFFNVKQDAQRDSSSSPVTTGADGGQTSQLVVCRNIFYNCEHAFLLKDHGTLVAQNNTIVRLVTNALARTGAGNPIPPGLILFGEPWRGASNPDGALWEGNIAYDLAAPIQANPFPLFNPAASFLNVSQSLIQGTNWPGPGNLSVDPLFFDSVNVNYTNVWSALALQSGSPCRGAGPNGLDMGAVVPSGASISGVPASPTDQTNITLRVAGPGVVAYRWRLNNGPWSAPVQLTNGYVITTNYFNAANMLVRLGNLTNGTYTFDAVGQNSAGTWQNTNSPATAAWEVKTQKEPQIVAAVYSDDAFVVWFEAEQGKTYSGLVTDSLQPPRWTKFADYGPSLDTSLASVTNATPAASSTRFYRIVTPAQP